MGNIIEMDAGAVNVKKTNKKEWKYLFERKKKWLENI